MPNGEYIVNLKQDDGLECDTDLKNTMPAHLGSFILSNNKRIMNDFIREINGLKNNVYYTDNDSLYIEKKYWDVLDKANLVGENLCQGKNDYESDGILYGLFLAPKRKKCSTIDEFGMIQEHKTFKGFSDSRRLLDRQKYFKMMNGEKVIANLPLSCKTSFSMGVVIPSTNRYCSDCDEASLCDKLVNQTKEFAANLNELKRKPANKFGQMLPWYEDNLNE